MASAVTADQRPRILIAESGGFPADAAARLREVGQLALADLDRGGLLSAVRHAHVLWVRLRHGIDAEVLDSAPHLQWIVTATTGLNHIDMESAARREIRVISLQGETDFLRDVRGTAEHTLGLMLALLRKLAGAAAHVLEGGWNRDRFRGSELFGKTVGIVGYGRLGRLVARYLVPFEARVLAADPGVEPQAVEPHVEMVPLPVLLGESEIVSLHVNLCPATRGFFGASQFALMKEGAWLVNTSRGELVDEEALLRALLSGRLRGAALDVLSGEQSYGMGAHPLVVYARNHDNLIVTPHLGGCTEESMEKTETFLAERLYAALSTRARSGSAVAEHDHS